MNKFLRKYNPLFFFCFVIILACTSCENTRYINRTLSQLKVIYVDQFKLTYFRVLLSKSYNNSAAVREIIENDYSGFTEPIITTVDMKIIDSLTTIDNQYLITDSAQGNERAEGSQGKRPMSFILSKMKSRELDKLAKERMSVFIADERKFLKGK